jgi:hypothetical protein
VVSCEAHKLYRKNAALRQPQELRDLVTGQANLRRESVAERTIFSKAMDWQYEKEWRVYIPTKTMNDEFLNFHAKELAAVYFGCRIAEFDRRKFRS